MKRCLVKKNTDKEEVRDFIKNINSTLTYMDVDGIAHCFRQYGMRWQFPQVLMLMLVYLEQARLYSLIAAGRKNL